MVLGYEISGEVGYLEEALDRAEYLKIGELKKSPSEYENAKEYSADLLEISNLPNSKKKFTNWQTNQGLRVFGWTHAYNIPYLLYAMEQENIE